MTHTGSIREVVNRTVTRLFGHRHTALPHEVADLVGHRTDLGSDGSFWALRDVSFEVKPGEVVGIIGRNGAGKSTLLKILSRITAPTNGRVVLNGRVASLLEVGTGFHHELSGRENVYLNGAILGMTKTEIRRKFDEIVAFAEIEKFIDTPVKRYSSGMYIRLAFAVAAHLEPEILVVDEVLAVGDAAFQKKCLGKMGEVAQGGRTVLFVSHNMAAVEHLCRRAVLLESGRMGLIGEAMPVIHRYLALQSAMRSSRLHARTDREGNGVLRFTEVRYLVNGQPAACFQSGQEGTIVLEYVAKAERVASLRLSIGLCSLSGQVVAVLGNDLVGVEFSRLEKSGTFCCTLPRLPLTAGLYRVNVYCEINGVVADWVQDAADVQVESGDYFGTGRMPPASHGGILIDQKWCTTCLAGV
jgi:lipopolysaccharide transport system ATP-binding protein